MVSHGFKFSISIVATAVLARLLTPHDYGLVGMVAVVTSFASLFKDLGLSLATVQKSEINYAQISTLFWINVALSVSLALIIVAMAPGVAWFFGEPRLTSITMLTSLGFILGGLSVQHEALLKRQMRFFALSLIAFVSMVSGYAAGIALAWHGAGYWALVFSQLTLLATNAVGVWLLCGWRPGLPRRNAGIRSMLSFGGSITGYSMVNYFAGSMDALLIGRFRGPEQLGLYAKAIQLTGLPTDQISEPIAAVTIPALSRLHDSPERYRQAYLRIMEKILMLLMPGLAFMIAAADWLVYIVLGPQWSETSRIFAFMAAGVLLQPLSTAGWLLVTQGRTQHLLYWSMLSAPVSVVFIVAGLHWGAVGVAASYALGKILVMYPLMFWFVGRRGPVRTIDFYRLIAPFAIASVSALLACVAFRNLAHPTNRFLGVAGCFIITSVVDLLVLCLVPAGRSALRDVWRTVLFMVPARRGSGADSPD
jgi:O-antigen/teichoic acid export membrane protein